MSDEAAVLDLPMTARLEAMRRRVADDFVDASIARLLDRGGDASLAQMARRLGMSSRTLVRRLAQRRTSYRTLVADRRRRRAIELLGEHGLTIAEIADRLGYEAATNFGRACRRWFGMSPTGYRRAMSSKHRIASVVHP